MLIKGYGRGYSMQFALSRGTLLGKSRADLVYKLRLLGADSQGGESKESMVSRLLMFTPPPKFDTKPPSRKAPVKALEEREIEDVLRPYVLRGLRWEVRGGSWYMSIKNRNDSGTLCMPLGGVERCARYVMGKD